MKKATHPTLTRFIDKLPAILSGAAALLSALTALLKLLVV